MLEYLLSPISVKSFVEDFWDTKPFFIQREAGNYYDKILDFDQVNSYLSGNDIRFPSIRIAKDGRDIPLNEYSNILSIGKYASEGLIDPDRLFDKLNSGASIFLQLMRSSIKTLSTFACELEKDLKFRVETHLFLTPNNSKGLTAHYDTTSSFIMQIYGEKKWIVYEPILNLPCVDQTFNRAEYNGSSKMFEVTLRAGDLMFLPRGFFHEAEAGDQVSLHVTTVLNSPTWIDYLSLAVGELKKTREFRESTTADFFQARAYEKLELLKNIALNSISYEKVCSSLNEQMLNHHVKDNDGRLLDYLNFSKINLKTCVAKRQNITYELIASESTVGLKFYHKKIEFPKFVSTSIDFILREKNITISDLPSILDDNGKLILVRKLIKEGFLKIVTV